MPRTALLERSVELDVLSGAVERLADRDGSVLVLEAGAGLGKTALLDHVTREATAAGFLVRSTVPGPLERHFPFGVVRALLEGPLRDASDEERERLLEGSAAHAGALLLDGRVPGGDATMLVAHSVMWLCASMADEQPLALIVDDAQWADRTSLQVLSYLARRVGDMPLLIVVAARADDPDAATDLLHLLGGVRAATVLHPQPLTPGGAVQLIHRHAPEAPVAVCRDCHKAVGGNPFLLGELAHQLAVHGPVGLDDPDQDSPAVSAIARVVLRRRLATLAPRDRAVAAALAVLGNGAAPHVLAALAKVPLGELGAAREALVAAGLLAADGDPRFVHGIVAVAVRDDIAGSVRERLHRDAARLLAEEGANQAGGCTDGRVSNLADVVASHLLQCGPQADPAISALLRDAAVDAAERGAPHTAAAYLERALNERAPGDDRGVMLSQLASVCFDAGLPDSRRRLREALDEPLDRSARVDVLTRLAALHVVDIGDTGLAQLFAGELAGERDPDTRLAVEAAALDALMMMADRYQERAERAAAIDLSAAVDPALVGTVLAHRAWLATELGTPDAPACVALVDQALEDGAILAQANRRAAYHLCVRSLMMTDQAPRARAAIAAMREHAMERGSLRLRAASAWYAGELALRVGRVAEAENEARHALDLVDESINMLTGGAVEVLVCALAERGAFQEAHDLLRETGLAGALGRMYWEIGVRHSRARLALAEGDFERAHAEALEAGALRLAQGRPNPTWTPWRATASLALSHLGRREEAAALADEELALAERFGAPLPIAVSLHARCVADPDEHVRIALARRAVDAVAGVEATLVRVRAQLELGAALARLGQRVEARDALRPALAAADEVGAVLLAERARRELVATGLRPRHAAIEGAAALTPRQRQVCELAARGRGNRAIAQELFLSVKTVETHLAAGYRKLGVNTRADLQPALAS